MSQEYTTEQLREFFDNVTLPEGPVQPNKYMIIHDVQKFVETQFIQIEHAPPGREPTPAYLRLVELKEWLEKGMLPFNQ